MFLFSLLAVGQLVSGGRHGGGRRRVLEAQRAADGRRQNDAQDDAADDDHDLLLRGGGSTNKTQKGGSRQLSRWGITGAQGQGFTALQSRAFWEFGVGKRYLAGLALVFDRLLGVGHGSLHIVDGVLHVVLDSVNHLPLKSNSNFQHVMLQRLSVCGSADAGGRAAYLALDQHGHVDEHVVQLADAVFKLDDLGVSGLDLVQGLLGHLGVHLDLRKRAGLGHVAGSQRGKPANSQNIIIQKNITSMFRSEQV